MKTTQSAIVAIPALNIDYEGAGLRVEIDTTATEAPSSAAYIARLYVNALLRDKASLAAPTGTLRLSTSLQTDYEYHEHVEAVVRVEKTALMLSLSANRQELACQTFPLTATL